MIGETMDFESEKENSLINGIEWDLKKLDANDLQKVRDLCSKLIKEQLSGSYDSIDEIALAHGW